jgi:hypothetical protein
MKVYHRTNGRGGEDADRTVVGVWVSTAPPLDSPTVELDIPDSLFERYEWGHSAGALREALIPAAVLERSSRSRRQTPPVAAAARGPRRDGRRWLTPALAAAGVLVTYGWFARRSGARS